MTIMTTTMMMNAMETAAAGADLCSARWEANSANLAAIHNGASSVSRRGGGDPLRHVEADGSAKRSISVVKPSSLDSDRPLERKGERERGGRRGREGSNPFCLRRQCS